MAIDGLDHITVNAGDLDASRRFYVDVLGLHDGDRPAFDVPGIWLYAGGHPIVHLVGERERKAANTGAFDHYAFEAADLSGVIARLKSSGIAYELFTVPGLGRKQVFVEDPDGVKIELNFGADEAVPDGA
jgi:catechol 2,3-dioxygenase-like lactoylglutathione lyase family enzyme